MHDLQRLVQRADNCLPHETQVLYNGCYTIKPFFATYVGKKLLQEKLGNVSFIFLCELSVLLPNISTQKYYRN